MKNTIKPKTELNFFSLPIEVTTVNNGQAFALTVQLTKEGDTPHNLTANVRVSKEQFSSIKDAYRAIDTGEFSLPEELKSYLISIQNDYYEGSALSITEDKIVQLSENNFAVGNLLKEYFDDKADEYSLHKILSQERWDSRDYAQDLFDSGNWTKINNWDLTPFYLEVGSLKVEYNENHGGFIYCRNLYYNKDIPSEIMVDYLECSPKSYEAPEQAQQALEQYLESI